MSQKIQKKKLFESFYFSKENYLILSLGLIIIAIGYYFSSINPWDSFLSLTVSPILLVFGYCIVIPFGILYKKK
ncbi:MAG: hypothetical protein AAB255_02350 [Bacteroidota bacterium]